MMKKFKERDKTKISFCGYDDNYKTEWTRVDCKHLVKQQWVRIRVYMYYVKYSELLCTVGQN